MRAPLFQDLHRMKHIASSAAARAALFGVLTIFTLTGCAGPSTQEINEPAAALSISGAPVTSVKAGDTYSFRPTVTGAAGTLAYSVRNKPNWASFSADTGMLTGDPAIGDVGSTSNIVISVNDGSATASLPAFSIAVTQVALGNATLSWVPPTQNTDGSALTTLAGYRIAYGTNSGTLDQTIEIANAGLTLFVIDNLSPGTYYFAVKAFTTSGLESNFSSVASKTIR